MMKFGELIAAIEKFLNDVLGNVIPGGVLLLGLDLLNVPELLGIKRLDMSDGGVLFVIIAIAYLLGHVIDELNRFIRNRITLPIKGPISDFLDSQYIKSSLRPYIQKSDRPTYKKTVRENIAARKNKKTIAFAGEPKYGDIRDSLKKIQAEETRRRREKTLHNDHSLSVFETWVSQQLVRLELGDENTDVKISDLRSIAMTLNEEGTILSRKFKFIELCCRGTATSLVILVFVFLLMSFLPLQDPKGVSPLGWAILILTIFTAYLLYARGREFYRRAATACYDCAVAEILKTPKPSESEDRAEPKKGKGKNKKKGKGKK